MEGDVESIPKAYGSAQMLSSRFDRIHRIHLGSPRRQPLAFEPCLQGRTSTRLGAGSLQGNP
jgi:hypothetical protein